MTFYQNFIRNDSHEKIVRTEDITQSESKDLKTMRYLGRNKNEDLETRKSKDNSTLNIIGLSGMQNNISLNLHPHKVQNSQKMIKSRNEDEKFIGKERQFYDLQNVFDSCDEKEMELDKEPLFLITLDSKFKVFWEILMLLSIFYSAFFSPIALCFYPTNHYFENIDNVIEILLIIDIFLSFQSQIEDIKENIISSSKLITLSYLKGWFFLDVITCFPASLILSFSKESHFLLYLKWFGLIRLLKLIKYPFFINKTIFYNESKDRVFKNIIILIVFGNILACFFIFLGLNSGSELNWINMNFIDETNNISIYIASIFYHFLALFTIGFGGVEGKNLTEKTYSVILLNIVILFSPYFMISLSKIFADDDENSILFFSKMTILEKVHKKLEFNKNLKNQIIIALKQENDKNFNQRENFFENLPINVRHHLHSYIFKKRLNNLLFFSNQTYEFILFTIPFLRHAKLKKSTYVYNIGEKVDEMFIVLHGSLSLCLGQEFSNFEVAVLRKNNYFGDIFLYTNKLCPFNLRVKKYNTEVFTINSKDYLHIKTRYPKNILNIIEDSAETLDFLNERKKNLIHLLEQEKTKGNVILKLKLINSFLLERDFDEFFYNNKELEGVNEFLVNNSFQNVKCAIEQQMKRKKAKFVTHKINKISKTLFKKMLNLDKSPAVIYQNSQNNNSFQENEVNRKSFKFSPFFRNATIKKYESIEKDRYERTSSKIFRTKENMESNRINSQWSYKDNSLLNKQRSSLFKETSSFKIKNDFSDEKSDKNIEIVDKTENEKQSRKKKKEKQKEIYENKLLELYRIIFEQELDIISLQKEKDIGQKISDIIISNQNGGFNDIDSMNLKLKSPIPYKHQYSFEEMNRNKKNTKTKYFLNNDNVELIIVQESCFVIENNSKRKKPSSFNNLIIEKNSFLLTNLRFEKCSSKYALKSKFSNMNEINESFKEERSEMKIFKFIMEMDNLKKSKLRESVSSGIDNAKINESSNNAPRSSLFSKEFQVNQYVSEINEYNVHFGIKNQNVKELSTAFNQFDSKLDRILNMLKNS